MRINLMNIWSTKRNKRQEMLHDLIDQFCSDYDIDKNAFVMYVTKEHSNADVLINYLSDKGYKVSRYVLNGAKKSDILSWGLEFDDECGLSFALKLRYSE